MNNPNCLLCRYSHHPVVRSPPKSTVRGTSSNDAANRYRYMSVLVSTKDTLSPSNGDTCWHGEFATSYRSPSTLTVEDIEHEMKILEDRLSLLRDRKHRLLLLHEKSSSQTAHIHSIPVEILTTIMLDTISSSATTHLHDEPSSLDVQKGAWVLARVCMRWRIVALAFPLLWTRIIIKELYRPSPNCSFTIVPYFRDSNPVQKLAEFLRRSGDAADLTVVFETTDSPTSRKMLSLIIQESHRWRTASFHISPHLIDLLNKVHGNVPRLHTLEFGLQSSSITTTSPLLAFSRAPELRELKIGPNVPGLAHTTDDPTFPIHLPFSQITHLRTGRLHGDELNLLRLCTNLQSFCGWASSNDSEEPVHLDSLTKLDSIYGDWVSSLTTPSLRALAFDAPIRSRSRTDLKFMKDLVARSGAKIETLELRNISDGMSITDHIMAWSTSLKDLRLQFSKLGIICPVLLQTLNSLSSLRNLYVDLPCGAGVRGTGLNFLLDMVERRGLSTELYVFVRLHDVPTDGDGNEEVLRMKHLRRVGFRLFYQFL